MIERHWIPGNITMKGGLMSGLGFLSALLTLLLTGCGPDTGSATGQSPTGESITNYDVRGVVLSLNPAESKVVIRHEEIPGYMMAMTMPFTVRGTNELEKVKAGDGVRFRMRVTETDGWIDQLQVISNAPPSRVSAPATNTAPPGFRVLPNVPDLKPGDVVPNYSFTNQFGGRFDLQSFRGQSLAVTFIFTRCPFPTFCPRITEQFGKVQSLLQAERSGPTNWHLLSLTFDPAFDTPDTMKAYGERWKADPARWTLATGSLDEIEPFAVSVGLYFGRDVNVANMNHNLRTLVIAPDGRLRQVLVGNEWSPAELAEALSKAALGRE
ncbi:MAG: SCO family protein [Verrucomicrobiales bacterium]|nr:SCO family protein [Verrucomicrobiales bacterium]